MSYGDQPMPAEWADRWAGTTCITQDGGRFFDLSGCSANAPLDGSRPFFSNNTYASDNSVYSMKCGSTTYTLAEAQAAGVDVGSVLLPAVPSNDEIVAAARSLLQF